MRKKIIGMLVAAFLAMLCAQCVTAQPPAVPGITVYAWTDKPQYKPGEKGILQISVLNERNEPIEIRNITIQYPWFAYDAKEEKWVGNETITLDPAEILSSNGGHYYKEVEFTIPSDGRATMGDTISIDIGTNKGIIPVSQDLSVATLSYPMSIVDLDTWMTSLIAAVVVCTIILAAVVFLATRRPRAPRVVAPPPPPKAKAT